MYIHLEDGTRQHIKNDEVVKIKLFAREGNIEILTENETIELKGLKNAPEYFENLRQQRHHGAEAQPEDPYWSMRVGRADRVFVTADSTASITRIGPRVARRRGSQDVNH